MEITPDKKKLIDLIERAGEGKIVLPQFQRTFVWEYNNVVDFLVSLFKGYFVGSFLFQGCNSENTPFDFRAIEGVEKRKEELRPEYMVLDGQQRLTTLYYVLYSPENVTLKNTKYPYRFFLTLDGIVNGDLDGAIFGNREDQSQKYFEREYQFENRVVPFSALQTFQAWDKWLDGYEDWLMERGKEDYAYFREKVRPVWKKGVNKFLDTIVPVIEIPKVESDDSEGIAEVCAIFEKMNTAGVRLSVFDLLTARLYKFGIDLHKLWEEALDEYDLIEDFSERDSNPCGIFILRFIALVRGLDVKSKSLINLSPEHFKEDWKTGAKYLQKAFGRTTSTGEDGFGVFEKKWMPYPPLAPTLATLLYQIDQNKLGSMAFKAIRKWYWGSVFGERYQSAVETKTTSDYRELLQFIKEEKLEASVFSEIDNLITFNDKFTLEDVNRINAVYKGVMNLLAINQAKDFRLQDNIQFHELDDHHIFPKAYLGKLTDESGEKRYKDKEVNTVLNKTLISSSTNRKISRKSPSGYVRNDALIKQSDAGNVLKAHFINGKAYEAMLNDDYEIFLNERDKKLVEKIRSLLLV